MSDVSPSPVPIPIVHLASVDSTNDEARRRLADGRITVATAILATEQTAGRGTRGRHWDSPAGDGLYLSLAVPGRAWPLAAAASTTPGGSVEPPIELAHTLAAGVAAVDAVERVFGVRARLKPVNDLLVDDRKLGGILVETVVRGGRTQAMVVGVGLNLRGTSRRVAGGQRAAVSVSAVRTPAGQITDEEVARLATELVAELAAWIARTVTGGPSAAVAAWRERAIPGAELPPGV